MDEIVRKVLLSTKGFLERLTSAEGLAPDLLTEAHMAVTAIGYQLARDAEDPARLARLREEERALANDLATQAPPVTRRWQDEWGKEVGAELTRAVAGGNALNSSGTDEATVTARRVRDFLVGYYEAYDPAVGAGTRAAYQGGRGDSREEDAGGAIYITAPRLEAYLRGRFHDHAETRVLDVKRLMGGYSKETYIVKLARAAGEETIVIRKDGYGLPTGSSVAFEFDVIKQVFDFGLPVPEPLWLETDPTQFSASFMAVGFLPGVAAHLSVPADQATRIAWAQELARVLAQLHRSTARPGDDVRDVMREAIADLQSRIEDRERSPHPGLALGMAWLIDHLDDLEGRPACRIHGDVGFHNILMRDGRILALLDWEYSHFSDPIEDLVYVKLFLDQIGCWDEFLAAYESQTSFGYDDKAARYFGVWKEVRNTVACLGSLNSLLLPQVKDVALSVAGTIYIPKFEIAILDAIIDQEPA